MVAVDDVVFVRKIQFCVIEWFAIQAVISLLTDKANHQKYYWPAHVSYENLPPPVDNEKNKKYSWPSYDLQSSVCTASNF